jgi:protoheme ferro-lyase
LKRERVFQFQRKNLLAKKRNAQASGLPAVRKSRRRGYNSASASAANAFRQPRFQETHPKMTNEQMERAIEFLLESQAALTARTEANTQAIEKLTRVVAELGVQLGQATQTALDVATKALLTTDNHERRLRALENPPS